MSEKLISQPLYKIADNFKEIERMVEDGEISSSDIQDQLEAFKGEFKFKAMGICAMIKNMTPVVDGLSVEIKRLQDRKKSIENRKVFFSKYLALNMEKIDEQKILGDIFNVTLCNGKEKVIIDSEDDLSDEFVDIDTVTTVNKKLLLERLKNERDEMEKSDEYDANNELIQGAHLERSDKYILIK